MGAICADCCHNQAWRVTSLQQLVKNLGILKCYGLYVSVTGFATRLFPWLCRAVTPTHKRNMEHPSHLPWSHFKPTLLHWWHYWTHQDPSSWLLQEEKHMKPPWGSLGQTCWCPKAVRQAVVPQKAGKKSSEELLTPARGACGAGAVTAGWTSSHALRATSPAQSRAGGRDSISY